MSHYGSGSQPFLHRGTLLSSLNFRGTPITENEYFLLIKTFCNKIIKNKEDHIKRIFIHINTTYPVFSTGYRIIMVNVSGTVVPGASLLLLQFAGECERDILLTLLQWF